MRILCSFLGVTLLVFLQKAEQDPRLVGKWLNLYTKDPSGIILKDMFSEKNYIETYAKNGTFMIDPNFLREDMKRNKISAPLDYSAIPTFNWKTINNEVLIMETGQGSQQIRYGFSGDTLLLGYPNGHTRYLLKRK